MAGSAGGLVLGAIGLAVVAIGLSTVTLMRATPTVEQSGTGDANEDRIAHLEAEIERLGDRGSRGPDAPRARVTPKGSEGADESVDERLTDMEESIDELEQAVASIAERLEAGAGGGSSDPLQAIREATPTPEQVAELRKLVLDAKAEPRPRLLALRELARVPDGRTIRTARAMRKLFESSEDEWTRSGVIGLLEGFVDPELEPWLIETLLEDRFSSTRENATDTLSHYTGSQRVRDALMDAAANDKNHDVRADAQNALDKLDEREDAGR